MQHQVIENTSSQTIELFLAGRNFKDLDFFSKSDPYVKVSYRRDLNAKNYVSLGRTQTVDNNLNPTFVKTITLQFIFESRQDIKFQVFDDDGNGNDDFIGSVETTVGALMGARNQTTILNLTNHSNKNQGKLIVRCESVANSGLVYEMKWKAQKLMNTDSYFDFWDKSDPYLKILKIRGDNSLIPVHKTQIIMNNLNPDWKVFQIQSSRLHSETSSKFKVQCWDWEKDGNDQFIGETQIDIHQKFNFPAEIILSNKKSKKPGKLVLQNLRQFQKPTFVEYLRGGLQLNMMIAIDFTGSNGTPSSPSSLHYMDPHKPNQYQTAILAIGDIMLNYDSDKRIPAFGFGASVNFPQYKGTSHCFPLSGDFNNVESFGIPHLMELYSNCLKTVSLSGPTYFSSIIEEAAKISNACKMQNQHVYQTLLILTDGEIHDMEKVIDLIIRCSELPLSIIIVGIGSADFTNMERLDGDNGLYGSKGQKAPRDIVQFVPFRDVKYNSEVLAQQLLAELPTQVVQYFQNIGVPARPAQHVKFEEVPPQQFGNQEFTQVMGNAGLFGQK